MEGKLRITLSGHSAPPAAGQSVEAGKQTTPVDEYGHFLLHYSLFDAYRAGFRKVVFVVKEDTAEEFRESVGPAVAGWRDGRCAHQKLRHAAGGHGCAGGPHEPGNGPCRAVRCARD